MWTRDDANSPLWRLFDTSREVIRFANRLEKSLAEPDPELGTDCLALRQRLLTVAEEARSIRWPETVDSGFAVSAVDALFAACDGVLLFDPGPATLPPRDVIDSEDYVDVQRSDAEELLWSLVDRIGPAEEMVERLALWMATGTAERHDG